MWESCTVILGDTGRSRLTTEGRTSLIFVDHLEFKKKKNWSKKNSFLHHTGFIEKRKTESFLFTTLSVGRINCFVNFISDTVQSNWCSRYRYIDAGCVVGNNLDQSTYCATLFKPWSFQTIVKWADSLTISPPTLFLLSSLLSCLLSKRLLTSNQQTVSWELKVKASHTLSHAVDRTPFHFLGNRDSFP